MEIITTISQFSPMATVALALYIIWQLVQKEKKIDALADNHLHEVLETLKRIENRLEKLDNIKETVEIIRVKLNGK